VAYVFITSGIMKLESVELSNYFLSLGLPYPLHTMYIISITEIICGIFIVINKGIRHAVIPLMIIMIAALLLTKVPLLHIGLVHFAFNARLDIVMLILLFILYNLNQRRP
jgi:putative oxidoreductase